jgi:hypothetical protein
MTSRGLTARLRARLAEPRQTLKVGLFFGRASMNESSSAWIGKLNVKVPLAVGDQLGAYVIVERIGARGWVRFIARMIRGCAAMSR